MKNCSLILFFKILILSLLFVTSSCSDDTGSVSCMPRTNVHAQYNMNLPTYNSLLIPNGYVELGPDGTNGTRGLIIINTGRGYRAYDRNAPHVCPDQNTTLKVVDGIKVVCPEDGAEWILLTGQPLNDATFGRPLYQYRVSENQRWISIRN